MAAGEARIRNGCRNCFADRRQRATARVPLDLQAKAFQRRVGQNCRKFLVETSARTADCARGGQAQGGASVSRERATNRCLSSPVPQGSSGGRNCRAYAGGCRARKMWSGSAIGSAGFVWLGVVRIYTASAPDSTRTRILGASKRQQKHDPAQRRSRRVSSRHA